MANSQVAEKNKLNEQTEKNNGSVSTIITTENDKKDKTPDSQKHRIFYSKFRFVVRWKSCVTKH